MLKADDCLVLNIRTIGEPDAELVAAKLPLRYERAQRFVREDDRLRSIGAGLLLLRLGLRDEADIEYGPHGKPSVSYLPHFNISHSGDYVVCAQGNAEIGVDIERPRKGNLKLAEHVFTEREREWMWQEDSSLRFLKLWTCKEAVMKLFGEGLHMPPESFDVMPLIYGEEQMLRGTTLSARSETFDDYVLAVAKARQRDR